MKKKIKNLFINNKKFATDTIWLLISQAVVIFSGILIVFLITNYIGLVALGYYTQIVSFLNILSIVFALGLNNTIIKSVSEDPTNLSLIKLRFTNSLFMTIVQSIGLSGLVYLITSIFPSLLSSEGLKDYFWIILIALPLYNINKNIDALYTGLRNQKNFSINKIVRYLTVTLIVLTGSYFKDLKLVITAFVISEFILLLFNLKFVIKHVDFKLNQYVMKKNLKFGLSTYIAEMISVVISNIDIIILGYLLLEYDLGLYSLIITIARTLLIFPNILSQNFNPIISKLWYENKKEELFEKYKKLGKINVFVSIFLFLFLLICYWIVISYYKVEYSDSLMLFLIVLFGIFISSTVSYAGGTFIMIGKNRLNNIRTFVISIISISVIYFMTKRFNLQGACFAVIINAFLQFIIFVSLMLKIKKSDI